MTQPNASEPLRSFNRRLDATRRMPAQFAYEELIEDMLTALATPPPAPDVERLVAGALRAYLDEFRYIDISDAEEDVPKLAAYLAAHVIEASSTDTIDPAWAAWADATPPPGDREADR